MRSALVICSFFILVIHKGSGAQYDFRPTPIPLTDWHDRRQGRATTLHETFRTETPPTVAAVPAHYWEDALRHSVYLTLVRDKIDQLIAKGDVSSTENFKPVSKEVDDHNLWEKIKTAPFDRIKAEEPTVVGDVTVMAKGRLLEEKDGFRFAEDDKSQDKCNQDNCMQGVKAIWSVKRVRQRDQEISPGKYHYELTFSVMSQPPLKKRKPYETPVRTFTVRESPSPFVGSNRAYDINRSPAPQHTPRPARAIWFHKNILPQQQQTKRQHFGALDRIFSSLFSDDDERSYEQPAPKYKPQPYSQHAKVGYVGASSDQHQQVNPPHRYRPPQSNFGRPPYGPPSTIQQQQHHQQYHQPQHQYQPPQQQYPTPQPQQPYQHFDVTPPTTYNDHNYHSTHDRRVEPYSTVKTTRPAVLPTPLPPLSSETTSAASYESLENVTNFSDFTSHSSNRFKPTSTKVSYFTDHVRPPVYNAPPGVFVTMDKKPFKPLPPLKLVHTKGHKNRPIDFRPSPQLHDHMIIDEDSFTDSAFRPINIAHNASSSFSDEIQLNKKPEQKHRKPTQGKKPSKKHSSSKRVSSTTAPDIITAQAVPEEDMDAIYWTNVLNSFTKTTPMSSQLEKDIVISTVGHSSTEETSSLSESSLEVIDKITTTPTVQPETTSAPTSPKPRKRTRPPPTFTKPEKVRKHKRITTSSTTTTATPRITYRSTESAVRKIDLTPQASSAPTGQRNKTTSTTTSTTSTSTTSTTTTTKAPTTTTTTIKPSTTARPVTTTERKSSSTTTLPRNRNRFRQSTLLIKGTSVKHDRWSVIGIQKNNTTPAAPSAASMSYRRKGSNFHGYSSTTPRNVEKEAPSTQTNAAETSTNYDAYESNSVIPLDRSEEENDFEEDESSTSSDESEDNEYYGETTTWASDKTNEVTSESEETTSANTASQTPKKICKKKKSNPEAESNDVATTAQPTTSETGTDDILSEILKFNFDNDIGNDTKARSDLMGQASINHGSYQKMDDDLKDFFDILNDKPNEPFSGPEATFNDDYGDDDKEFEDVEDRDTEDGEDDDDSYDAEENTSTPPRQSKSKSEKPFSFLDLLV